MKKILILMIAINSYPIFAQKSTSGLIFYRKSIELPVPKDNDLVYKNEVKSIYNSLNRMNYTLKFNKEASYFGLDIMMDSDLRKLSRKAITKGKGKSDFYTNLKSNKSIQIVEKDGKTFLVETSKPVFKLLNETKKIGGYTCYKATTSEINNMSKFNEVFSKFKSNLVDKEIRVVAWYTKDIAVPFAPLNFFGLPGLVLELQYANTRYTAIKINMNNSNTKISAPTKGKIMSKEEYEEMLVEGIKNISN